MAQQEIEWLKEGLERMEHKIEHQEKMIEAAIKDKELLEHIATMKEKRDRFVNEKKDMQQNLRDVQISLATPSGEVLAAARC